MKSILSACIFLCGLSIAAIPAFADTSATGASQNAQQSSEWCAQNQQECKQKMEKLHKWCRDNPQKCATMKERHRAKIEAYCKQNPSNQRCEKLLQNQQNGTGNKANNKISPPPGV